ncbi:MAG: type II toxin-antitoxin system HipA family toxin YjjJ [Thiolinea sp.]
MDIQTRLAQALFSENLSSAELARRMGISQATISRALQQLTVIKLGAGRNSVFAWVDQVDGHPLYAINPQGQPEQLATLYRQPAGQILVVKDHEFQRFDDIPWFLQSALPAGFLGRWHAEHLSQSLAVNKNPALWTSDEALRYLLQAGDQLPGNLLVGETSAQTYLNAYQNLNPCSVQDYDQLAAQMLQHGFARSSVGGEQPKFLVYTQNDTEAYHAIVKYSPPIALQSPAAQRYRDLLIAEHLALQCLQEFGITATQSRLIEGERVYLELRRFDRVGEHGRRGIVSLKEVEAEFIGSSTHWYEAANALLNLGLIDKAAQQQIHLVYAFGHFIANTDMHFGNLAFYFEDLKLQGLAPIYDMLPMFYMPIRDEVVERDYQIKPLLGIDAEIIKQAYFLSNQYWNRIKDSKIISKSFKVNIQNHY